MKRYRVEYYYSSTSHWSYFAFVDAVSQGQAILIARAENGNNICIWGKPRLI
jgi:hypothetical protein